MYACDWSWWKQYALEVSNNFTGERWTVSTRVKNEYKANWILGEPTKGASKKTDAISTGQNSGYQAIELARHWGAKRILLLGYDFKYSNGRKHWHGDHPGGLGNGGNFNNWALSMQMLADDLKALGVEVVNCSRQTALKCFKRSTLELEGIK